MKRPEPSQCRSCKATVYWVVTANGKRMPINAQPDPHGGFVVTQRDDGELYAEVFYGLLPEHSGRRRFTSHFATCPDAASWRQG